MAEADELAGDALQVELKIVILGNSGVGKTNLVKAYRQRQYKAETHPMTIGVDFSIFNTILTLTKPRQRLVMVRTVIWDTAGQEKYQAISTAYMRHADAFVFAFDPPATTGRGATSMDAACAWHNRTVGAMSEAEREAVCTALCLTKSDLLTPEARRLLAEREPELLGTMCSAPQDYKRVHHTSAVLHPETSETVAEFFDALIEHTARFKIERAANAPPKSWQRTHPKQRLVLMQYQRHATGDDVGGSGWNTDGAAGSNQTGTCC